VVRLIDGKKGASRFFSCLLTLTVLFSVIGAPLSANAQLPNVEKRIEDIRVMPGGQTVGVKLKTVGVVVIGHHQIERADNKRVSPAELARIQLGDVILRVNGERVQSAKHFAELVQKGATKDDSTGDSNSIAPLNLQIVRDGQTMTTSIQPILDKHAQKYRLGIYVRDQAAGIGTLTFYSPLYKMYGALGHMITDADTHVPLSVENGEILPSEVTSIRKGEKGQPGEKRAQIVTHSPPLGNIEKNTPFGIFGELSMPPIDGKLLKPLPIAGRNEVREGPAKMLTVIEGQKVEAFDIEIVHLNRQSEPETKGMVVRVTDPRLLEKSGGIVQGMSGSPIIQNGKLVGAVTHVFVNDPTSGYGCYIEWMLRDAGVKVKAA
jgi:stage IV sporulation protein B